MANVNETPFPPAAHRLGESADWVVGVIDDREEAQRAVRAAGEVGYSQDDVVILQGVEALDLQRAKEQQNPLNKAVSWLARALTDPGTAEQEYIEEARRGHSIVRIRAEEPNQVERAVQLLDQFHAHRVKHFGRWVQTDR